MYNIQHTTYCCSRYFTITILILICVDCLCLVVTHGLPISASTAERTNADVNTRTTRTPLHVQDHIHSEDLPPNVHEDTYIYCSKVIFKSDSLYYIK